MNLVRNILRPSRRTVLIAFLLFALTSIGRGFPFTFFAIGVTPFLSAGFFYPLYAIFDILFWYIIVVMYEVSQKKKLTLGLIVFFLFLIWYYEEPGIEIMFLPK